MLGPTQNSPIRTLSRPDGHRLFQQSLFQVRSGRIAVNTVRVVTRSDIAVNSEQLQHKQACSASALREVVLTAEVVRQVAFRVASVTVDHAAAVNVLGDACIFQGSQVLFPAL